MRVVRSSVLGAVLLAAHAGRAEEGVSLESAKQELRQLESTQKNQAGALTPAPLKLDTPTLHLDGAVRPAVSVSIERKREDEERARRAKQRKDANWLVNGVERLAREETGGGPGVIGDDSAELNPVGTAADPADPSYLLKLFDAQGQRHASSSMEKPRPTPAPDPFAPFLRDWLGSSPVRSQVMDQLGKSAGAAGPTLMPPSARDLPAPAATDAPAGPLPFAVSASAQANPYLVEADFPAPTNNTITAPVSFPGIERGPLNSAPAVTPAPAAASPAGDARIPAKAPPSSTADDKKYFPQLNRF